MYFFSPQVESTAAATTEADSDAVPAPESEDTAAAVTAGELHGNDALPLW